MLMYIFFCNFHYVSGKCGESTVLSIFLFNIKHIEFYRLTEIKINDKENHFMLLKMCTEWISELCDNS